MTSTYHRHNQHHCRCCLLRIAATDLRNENWVRLASLYIFFLSLSFCPLLEIIRSIRGAWYYAFSISYGTVHKHYGCHEYYDLSAVWTFDDYRKSARAKSRSMSITGVWIMWRKKSGKPSNIYLFWVKCHSTKMYDFEAPVLFSPIAMQYSEARPILVMSDCKCNSGLIVISNYGWTIHARRVVASDRYYYPYYMDSSFRSHTNGRL